jgi:antitoxin ParD1/3/4
MSDNREILITLPEEMAKAVEAKVNSGTYASAGDVVREGLRALLERDAAIENWLREEVVSGHREYLADPTKAVSADAILERIKERRRRAV